jgi:hypothetical protein
LDIAREPEAKRKGTVFERELTTLFKPENMEQSGALLRYKLTFEMHLCPKLL